MGRPSLRYRMRRRLSDRFLASCVVDLFDHRFLRRISALRIFELIRRTRLGSRWIPRRAFSWDDAGGHSGGRRRLDRIPSGHPHLVLLVAICAILAELVMRRTRYGSRLYAIGGNPEAARLSGINVQRVIFWNFGSQARLRCHWGRVDRSGERAHWGHGGAVPRTGRDRCSNHWRHVTFRRSRARGRRSAGGTIDGQLQQRHEPHERADLLSNHGARRRSIARGGDRSHRSRKARGTIATWRCNIRQCFHTSLRGAASLRLQSPALYAAAPMLWSRGPQRSADASSPARSRRSVTISPCARGVL